MRTITKILIVVLGLSVAVVACDKGGDGAPENVTMATQNLSLNEHNFTIQAPEEATPEVYMNLAWHLFADNWFKIRVTPGDWRQVSDIRAQYEGMNYDSIEFPVDEENALIVAMTTGDRTEHYVLYKTQIGETEVICESVDPVGDPFSREMADRMLESCRSLSAAE